MPFWIGDNDVGMRVGAFGETKRTYYLSNGVTMSTDRGVFTTDLKEDGRVISTSQLNSYFSKLDFERGVLTQVFKTDNATYQVQSFAEDSFPELCQIWTISNNKVPISISLPADWKIRNTLFNSDGKLETTTRFSTIDYAGDWTHPRADIEMRLSEPRPPESTVVITQVGNLVRITFAPSKGGVQFSLASVFNDTDMLLRAIDPDYLLKECERTWANIWNTDIEIEGPVEDQQFIRSVMYYLRTSSPDICPPMATSSETYKGHRFWDAEAWMLPVYAFIDRDAARRITAWRLNNSPNGNIPWEAGPKGEDFTDNNFRKAIHQYGWVSWWLERAVILGLAEEKQTQPLQAAITKKFESKATLRNNQLEFLDVESPDEGLERNNDLVTNLLAERSLKNYPNRYRDALASNKLTVKLPAAEDGLPATYDNDHLNGYQQTAALLAIYPLEAIKGPEIQSQMFDRYKDKTDPSGPAMSDSIHATIAARLNRPEEAYALWRKSWQDFVRADGLLFSERRNRDVEYFSTGAAGCVQTVLYGFLGLRIEKGVGPLEKNQINLTHGYRLYVRPNLPPAWKSLTFKGIQLPGGNYTIRVTHNDITITKGG